MGELQWSPLASGEIPNWDGQKFWVGAKTVPYLTYSENLAGWDDGLTSLHKRESAGLHPIDVTSRGNAMAALRKAHPGGPATILEIGSSDGYMLRDLRAAYPRSTIVGSEVAPEALRQIADEQPGIPLVQFDVVNCPLPARSFDAVIALNVLEHIDDDRSAIANMAQLLAPGGILVIEVPAGPGLYDAYDRQLHHFRRYTMREIEGKVTESGLRIEHRTHVGYLLYPGFAIVKKANRLRDSHLGDQDVVTSSIRQTRGSLLVGGLFALERAMFGRMSWPFGIRCFLAARKS